MEEIKIDCINISSSEVEKAFKKYIEEFCEPGDLKIVTPNIIFRSTDPGSLVAILSASSAALAAFITGLLAIVQQVKASKIEIHDKEGRKIIIPSNMSIKKITHILEIIKKMENPGIIIARK